MKDQPKNLPPPPPDEKSTPPPDDPGRRSAEWENLEQTPEDAEQFALRRLKALQSTRTKPKT